MTNSRLEHLQNKLLVKREMTDQEIDELKKQVGFRLKVALETESYSEIARLLDIPSVTNAKIYVDGQRFPSPEVLQRFAARGFSIDWLMTGEGSMRKTPSNLFSEEHEQGLQMLARINKISYWEQVERLTRAGLEFLEEIDKKE